MSGTGILIVVDGNVIDVEQVSTALPEDRKVSTALPGRKAKLSTGLPGREAKVSTTLPEGAKVSTGLPGRERALTELRNHLRVVASYHPNFHFKTDLVSGGVKIRMYKWDGEKERMVARTIQSDKLLRAVNQPDFLDRLVRELKACKFPIKGK